MIFDPLDTVALTSSTDPDLLQTQAELVAERRRVDARLAAVAGEIARRSAPDAGMAGLAQRTGDRTAAKLIERTTGIGPDEARRLIDVGGRVRDHSDPVGAAVAAGRISVAAAAAITGELTKTVGDVENDARACCGGGSDRGGCRAVGERGAARGPCVSRCARCRGHP